MNLFRTIFIALVLLLANRCPAGIWDLLQMKPSAYDSTDYGEVLFQDEVAVLWSASSGWKIPPQRVLPEKRGAALSVSMAANEAEAVQLVVHPTAQPLKGLRSVASALINTETGDVIPASAVEILREYYHNVRIPTESTGKRGLWPDALPPIGSKGLACAADQNQPLWIRVTAPKGTPAGIYDGSITLSANNGAWQAEIPLRAEVFGFELPDRMTCNTAFGFDKDRAARYHGATVEEEQRKIAAAYFRAMARYHLSPYDPAPYDTIKVWVTGDRKKPKTLGIGVDFSKWDAAVEKVLDELHATSFRLPIWGLGGGTFFERVEPSFAGYKKEDPLYDKLYGEYLRRLEKHLAEKGWLEQSYVYWFDEPDPKDYEFVMEGFRMLKRHAPRIRRFLTEEVVPELIGGPNLWCPITKRLDPATVPDRRAAGDQFWWYVCTVPKAPYATEFIDHAGTEMRVWLWQTWQYGIEGVLLWDVSYWTSGNAYPDPEHPQNPYRDPMGWKQNEGLKVGERRPWGNGDGRLLYPPLKVANGNPKETNFEDPVGSIRGEMLRDGIEDYEYFAILKRLLDKKGDELSLEQRQAFEKLLKVPEEVSKDRTNFTFDPAPIEIHREKLARAIETLTK